MSKLFYDEVDSPLGTLTLLAKDRTLIRVDHGPFLTNEQHIYRKWLKKYLLPTEIIYDPDLLSDVKKELHEYFIGSRTSFTVPFQLIGTTFQKRVLEALLKVPFGEVKTYQYLAEQIGKSGATQAVGGALNQNPLTIIIPCHRIVGKNGALTGYRGGIERKQFLLRLENNSL